MVGNGEISGTTLGSRLGESDTYRRVGRHTLCDYNHNGRRSSEGNSSLNRQAAGTQRGGRKGSGGNL